MQIQFEVKAKVHLKIQLFINFKCRNAHSNPLFYKHEVIEFPAKIIVENDFFYQCVNLIIHQFSIIGLLLYETSCSSKGFSKVNISNTKEYGRKA